MSFRKPKQKELKRILSALRYFDSLSFLRDHDLFIKESGRREVWALSKDLSDFLVRNGLLNVVASAGIKVGEVGRRFRFSLEGTFWLVKNNRKKIWVNDKGEMLFLYGRDIFASSVIRAESFGENDIVFVCNRRDDVIGIGKSRFPADKIREVSGDRVVVENLVDRGEYLRHTRLYECF